ncbi:DNA ligase [compost metagenome]
MNEIGTRIAESVTEYFAENNHRLLIEQLKQDGLQFEIEEKEIVLASNKLEGKTFLISGVFDGFGREELKDLIEANGGKMLSSISSKLNFLVAGDNMGPSKLKKATDLSIPIISDKELLSMLN